MSFIRELDFNETNLVSGGCFSGPVFGGDCNSGFGFGFGFDCFRPSAASLGAQAGFLAARYNLSVDFFGGASCQTIVQDLKNICAFQQAGASYGSSHSYAQTVELYNNTISAIQNASSGTMTIKVTFPPSVPGAGGLG